MPCKIENSNGSIVINNEVVARIAGFTAMECYGVVGMAAKNLRDGVIHLLRLENLTKGIRFWEKDGKIGIDLHIIVEFGTNIVAISESLMDTVKYKVEDTTGLRLASVNVYVEGLRVDG